MGSQDAGDLTSTRRVVRTARSDVGADEVGGGAAPTPTPKGPRPRPRPRRDSDADTYSDHTDTYHRHRHRLPAWWARGASTRHPAPQFDDTSGTNNHDLGCYTRCRPARRSAPVRRRQRQATVADSALGRLTTDSTVQAPVKPTALGTTCRAVLVKEQRAQLWHALYAGNSDRQGDWATIFRTQDLDCSPATGLTLNTWTHLAATWDADFRVYVNGAPALYRARVTGRITTSNSPLRIGGNTIWSGVVQGSDRRPSRLLQQP